jgi:hypothetical protein
MGILPKSRRRKHFPGGAAALLEKREGVFSLTLVKTTTELPGVPVAVSS